MKDVLTVFTLGYPILYFPSLGLVRYLPPVFSLRSGRFSTLMAAGHVLEVEGFLTQEGVDQGAV